MLFLNKVVFTVITVPTLLDEIPLVTPGLEGQSLTKLSVLLEYPHTTLRSVILRYPSTGSMKTFLEENGDFSL